MYFYKTQLVACPTSVRYKISALVHFRTLVTLRRVRVRVRVWVRLGLGKVFQIGTVCYNWPMSAHASQAFSKAHCTDSEDLPGLDLGLWLC